MTGISSQAAKGTDYAENKKGFNGNELQSKEFSDLSGLAWYDFNARTYDQQTGRFLQVDPMSNEADEEGLSPYHFADNNPILLSDPTGKCPCFALPILAKAIAAAVGAAAGTVFIKDVVAPAVARGVWKLAQMGAGSADASIPLRAQVERAKIEKSLPKSGEQKKVPNPNGKKGGEDHQRTVNKEEQKLRDEGYDVVNREVKVDTKGGNKDTRYADLEGTNTQTGETKQIQVGKQNKNGTPVSRERKAMDDIENSTNKRPTFIPYNN